MPWQSLNASRTRRSETPAAALRSLSVTPWYCTLAAYCTHVQTMRKLAGRTARAGDRVDSGPGRTRDDCRVLQRDIDDPQLPFDMSPRVNAVVLLARVGARRQRPTSASNRSSERMICLRGAVVVLRIGCFAQSASEAPSSDSDDVRQARQLWRAPSMSYPMPRAIAGAAEATRARPMIVATLINVATMSSSHAPASNARAIALRQSASGARAPRPR